MKILADPGIAQVRDAFSTLGEVKLVAGREMSAADAQDADMLCVRSVTRVDAGLLEGSRVRFVGTATAGLEHVDQAYLASRSIGLAGAHGSNANAVAEYVLSAVFRLCELRRCRLHGLSAGVIGFGAIGTRLVAKLEALGVECLVNDPPLAMSMRGREFVSLREAMAADIVSVHVPLTAAGRHKTLKLIDAEAVNCLARSACLINTARGGVVDEKALLARMQKYPDTCAVIDCWEGEPDISPELLERAFIATAHIAGHSLDGKIAGTKMIYDAACRYLKETPTWNPSLPPADSAAAVIDQAVTDERAIRDAVLHCYDVARDSSTLKAALSFDANDRRRYFDTLRSKYGARREFHTMRVTVPPERRVLSEKLRALGFRLG